MQLPGSAKWRKQRANLSEGNKEEESKSDVAGGKVSEYDASTDEGKRTEEEMAADDVSSLVEGKEERAMRKMKWRVSLATRAQSHQKVALPLKVK